MAHDFKHLMTAILGNLSTVLANTPRTDQNHESLVAADKAALQAGEIIKQLLSFSQRRALRLERTCMNAAIREVVDFAGWLVGPRITVEFDAAPDLWDVQADQAHLRDAVLNLCLNACDAMPQGGQLFVKTENVVVEQDSLPAQPPAEPGDYVRLRIRDTGQGVSPEPQSPIFDPFPFFTATESGQASGMGLAMVFGIVEEHGGRIHCTSEEGRGTCFDIYLRRLSTESAPDPAFVEVESRG